MIHLSARTVLNVCRCPKNISATYPSMTETLCTHCQAKVLIPESRIASFDRKIHGAVFLSPSKYFRLSSLRIMFLPHTKLTCKHSVIGTPMKKEAGAHIIGKKTRIPISMVHAVVQSEKFVS